MLDAYRARAICMVNSFRSKVIHKKALFAVLTDARYASLFSPDERTMIAGHVPWTRRVRAGKSDYFGEEIDLLEFIGERRDRLVLKRSEEHTSELQSPCNLVCRLLLEKKKKKKNQRKQHE